MLTLQPGSLIAARYRLERPLAQGGMGSVWVGRHLQLDVPIAVKFMDASVAVSPDARMRFEREAKAAARLKSPHIIQVHDYGIEDGTPYIVMELLDGEGLDARLHRVERLGLAAAAPIAVQIAKALRSAHEAGIVHRDLKPGNVFLCRHHDEEIVKVLDFGIAKATGEAQAGPGTVTGLVMGSVHYMSPEQTRAAKDLDGRSDLWSLGVILYRCVTGRLPFLGDQISLVLVAINMDPIPMPSQIAPDLGPNVDRFFARALARDPAQRFQSARELAEGFVTLANAGSTDAVTVPLSRPFASSVDATSSVAPLSAATLTSTERTLPVASRRRSRALLPVAGGALLLAAIGSAVLVFRPGASSQAPVVNAERSAAPPTTMPTSASRPTASQPTALVVAPSASSAIAASSVSMPPPPASARAPLVKAPAASPMTPKKSTAQDPTFGF